MYPFKTIERKWQKAWKTKRLYQVKNKEGGKKNFYHLVMFPYPSGDLHVGHWRNFAPADVYARMKRMQGFNVFSPMGFDAFGLPAENAALKHGTHPEKWTMKNIKTMTTQLESMGNSYDWSKSVITCLPDYYKWNQWLFLKLYEKGLAYRKKAPANWCTSCKTVLANEQVVDGRCERCGHDVIQREINQWLFKITDYAERLLADLEKLDWPERTKTMQKNWLGRSEGVLIKFQVSGLDLGIDVFTTRPDTVRGATYMVLAPEHEIIEKLKARIKNWQPVQAYIDEAKTKTEKDRIEEGREKTGVELTGLTVLNPITKEEIPVWISDYVVGSYGTGAIMAVPAHDERDKEFAQKFELPISEEPLLDPEEAVTAVNGKKAIQFRLRDWLISRQRYWGTPIPIIHCMHCGMVPVPEKDLPIKLPKLKDFKPADDGRSPLARDQKWLETRCPKCKGCAERETDTMDTFVDSSWYFLRYPSAGYKKAPFEEEATKAWLPVTMYIGGAEHSVLHLLYARFFAKFLKDADLIEFDEPFTTLRHQGIVLGPDGQKMSKSKGNVVDPDKIVKEFGTDAARMYLCFVGDFAQMVTWDPQGIMGVARFLDRVYALEKRITFDKESAKDSEELTRNLHKTIKKVGEDIEAMKFNTAISALMILLNETEKAESISPEFYLTLLKLLAPFAPHLAEEQFQKIRATQKERGFISMHFEEWPKAIQKYLRDDTYDLVIQVNGKVRDVLTLPTETPRDEVERRAKESEAIKKFTDGKEPERLIYVPQKLVNIVVKE